MSIYLLLQKHTERIRTLLLIGSTRSQVALPFHLLSIGLHSLSLLLSLLALHLLRGYWLPSLQQLYPRMEAASLLPALLLMFLLFLSTALLNFLAVRTKVKV